VLFSKRCDCVVENGRTSPGLAELCLRRHSKTNCCGWILQWDVILVVIVHVPVFVGMFTHRDFPGGMRVAALRPVAQPRRGCIRRNPISRICADELGGDTRNRTCVFWEVRRILLLRVVVANPDIVHVLVRGSSFVRSVLPRQATDGRESPRHQRRDIEIGR